MKEMKSAEEVHDEEGRQYHIALKPGELADYILYFGDPDRPERFAPWHAAKVVCFWPPPFDQRCPAWTRHFVAYVRGANGVKELP